MQSFILPLTPLLVYSARTQLPSITAKPYRNGQPQPPPRTSVYEGVIGILKYNASNHLH